MKDLIEQLASRPDISRHLPTWNSCTDQLLEDTLRIQAIPAPSLEEKKRAHYVREIFESLNLVDVEIDSIFNVYGRTLGQNSDQPALLVSAHLDTVFPAETDLTTRRENGKYYGPGIGDNSLGVAGLIGLARFFQEEGIQPPCDIWWVATVGEEGIGNLKGIREVIKRLKDRIGQTIIIEGMGLGKIYNKGLNVRRLQIDLNTQGGHSWLQKHRASAIHQAVQLCSQLVTRIVPPEKPESSFNIGLISGGTSINTRAPHASFSLDMRSVDTGALMDLENQVLQIVAEFEHPEIITEIQVIGDRPGKSLDDDHPLVQGAVQVLDYLAHPSSLPDIGSTDANIPLYEGIPTVCVGITTGGDAHTLDEYMNVEHIGKGMTYLFLLIMMAVEHMEEWKVWR